MLNAPKSKTRRSVFDASKPINRNGFGQREHDDDEGSAANEPPPEFELRIWQRNDFRAEQIIKRNAPDQQQRVSYEPEFIGAAGFDFFARLFFAGRFGELLADLGFFADFLSGFGHQVVFVRPTRLGRFDRATRF